MNNYTPNPFMIQPAHLPLLIMMLWPIIQVAQIWVPRNLFGEAFGCYVSQTKSSILPGELVVMLSSQWLTFFAARL